ncbi:MAG: tyrosine-type recombinase/integrase [Terriglobales bacterium]
MLIKRGRMWTTRVIIRGRLYQKSLKTRDKKEASKREAAFVTDVMRGDFDLSKTTVPRFYQFEEQVFNALRLKVQPRTLEFYRTAFKSLAHFVPLGSAPLNRIDAAVIEQFVQNRSKDVGVATVNHSLRTLCPVLRLAEEWKIIRKAPKVKLLTGENVREFVITDAVLKKMLAHKDCTPLLRDMLPFLIDTGLRISEALALTWDNVLFDKGEIFVSRGKSENARRHIPMTDRVRDILTRLRQDTGHVFPCRSRHWVSEQFRTLRDAMKLPDDCVIHSTRHTFLRRLGESGCDVWTLMKLAGHSTVTISQRYVHPSADRFESAINKLNS